jgi:hypothetical protein
MFVLTLADGLCCAWFVYLILCWCIYPEKKELALLIGPTEYVPPEDGDRIQSLKCCVLDKNRTMDNVQKHNSCTVGPHYTVESDMPWLDHVPQYDYICFMLYKLYCSVPWCGLPVQRAKSIVRNGEDVPGFSNLEIILFKQQNVTSSRFTCLTTVRNVPYIMYTYFSHCINNVYIVTRISKLGKCQFPL